MQVALCVGRVSASDPVGCPHGWERVQIRHILGRGHGLGVELLVLGRDRMQRQQVVYRQEVFLECSIRRVRYDGPKSPSAKFTSKSPFGRYTGPLYASVVRAENFHAFLFNI